jgi:transposase-like protein
MNYSDEMKQRAIAEVQSGKTPYRVSQESGIPERNIVRWITAAKQKDGLVHEWLRGKPSSANPARAVVDNEVVGSPHEPDDKAEADNKSIVLAIPDMHHPFCHPDALEFLKAVRHQFNPTSFVCLGDECDFAAFSRYIPDPDGMSPGKELEKAIDSLIPFYREFPNMLICESNHTVRPMKKMFEAGLPATFLPTYAKMLNAPDGWRWAQFWEIDGVRYHHGDAGRSGQFAPAAYLKAFKQSHVHGHLHGMASVMYEGKHFGVNAGCLIDPQAYAFKYAKNHPIPVNLGCALIFEGEYAIFQPMRTDKHGRWIGRL